MDPFRTRAALWSFLPAAARRPLLRRLETEIRRLRDDTARALPALNADDAATDVLLLALLDSRLIWLKTQR